MSVGGVLITFLLGSETVGGQATKSVTHDQCYAKPAVTFPSRENHYPPSGRYSFHVSLRV